MSFFLQYSPCVFSVENLFKIFMTRVAFAYWHSREKVRLYYEKKKAEDPNFLSERNARLREWKAKNPERFLALVRNYKKKNVARILAAEKAWRIKNPERYKAIDRRSKIKNAAARKVRVRTYHINNKAKINKWKLIYERKRMAKNPIFRMIRSFRGRLSATMANKGGNRTWDLLGCSPEQLRSHLEALFRDGMNWSNYGLGFGKWVVDHIKPIAAFDHNDQNQVKKCWHHTNLQPLWFEENTAKGDKILV